MRHFYFLSFILLWLSIGSSAQSLTADEQQEINVAQEYFAITGNFFPDLTFGNPYTGTDGAMEDFIPTAGATETFTPAVGDFFYDTGGPGGGGLNPSGGNGTELPGNYLNCGCITTTTLAGVTKIEFHEFEVFGNFDWLKVYDGTDTSGTVLYDSNTNGDTDTFAGMIAYNGSGVFIGTSGAMTFEFNASTVVDHTGWEVEILAPDSEPESCEPGNITTTFVAGNQFAGNMFDVTASGGEDLLIEKFDVNIGVGSAAISVYTRPGSYIGFEGSATGWTLMGTETVTGAGESLPTEVNIGGFTIPAGETYGFYVTISDYTSGNVSMYYTNGLFTYSDDFVTIETGTGKGNPDFTGSTFPQRSWNGTLYYCAGEGSENPDPEPEVDCSGPNSIIHDDGSIENGASGNPSVVTQMIFTDKFTPLSYPATIESVCAAFIMVTGATPDLPYDIVVYDDDGTGGAPGTLIGELNGLTATNIPLFSAGAAPEWQSASTTSENWVITEGSVYIGVRFAPTTPNHYIATDESTSTPSSEGYWWNDNAGDWALISVGFPNYRSLFVRAVITSDPEPEPEVDCSGPNNIIHDDGSIENGASGNPSVVTQMIFTDKFTPLSYPATIESVCAAFIMVTGATPDLPYDIVVYDDDGTGGAPGTLIGELNGLTATNIPLFSAGAAPEWQSASTTSENWVITEGSVYIGVRFAPTTPNHYIATDESTSTPSSEGYWWNDNADDWALISVGFPNYRSLFVRAAFTSDSEPEPDYCEPELDCTDNDMITNVTFQEINNDTNCSPNGYGNYTDQIANVVAGETYPISVSVGNGWAYESVSVWIDFDNSGTFDQNEFTYVGTGSAGPVTGEISIPSGVANGQYRMRVRVAAVGEGSATWDMACDESQGYGETEDYTVAVNDPEEPPVDNNCSQEYAGDTFNGIGIVHNSSSHYIAANDVIVEVNTMFTLQKITLEIVTLGGEPTTFDVSIYEDEGGTVGNQFGATQENITPVITPNGTFGSTSYPQYTVEITLPTAVELPATTTDDVHYWIGVSGAPSTTTDNVFWVSYEYTEPSDSYPTWQSANGGTSWDLYANTDGINVDGNMIAAGLCYTLGVSDINSFDFTYYPNPVRDVLNISSKKEVENVSVYNLAGQQILTNAKVDNGQINVSSLPAGTYVFRVILKGGQVETFKIIKK